MSAPAGEMATQSGRHNPDGWTSTEIVVLRVNARHGAAAVALLLGRSVNAVRMQARRQRISLRRVGERRGLILGQPRGESWGARADTERLRAAVLAGHVDPTSVEETIARMVDGHPPPLCPLCAARYADHRSGVCRPCHVTALAEAHRDADALQAAQQQLWTARQRKSRARREGAG